MISVDKKPSKEEIEKNEQKKKEEEDNKFKNERKKSTEMIKSTESKGELDQNEIVEGMDNMNIRRQSEAEAEGLNQPIAPQQINEDQKVNFNTP